MQQGSRQPLLSWSLHSRGGRETPKERATEREANVEWDSREQGTGMERDTRGWRLGRGKVRQVPDLLCFSLFIREMGSRQSLLIGHCEPVNQVPP